MAKMLHFCCLLGLLWTQGGTSWATDIADAEAVQQTLPELLSRASTAEATAADGAAFFRGEHSLARAFPDLAQAPLFQPGFIADARRGLLAAAQARAAARRLPPPQGLSADVQAQWVQMWARVHRAEDARDAQQERLLASIAAGLAQAPDLSSTHTSAQEATWMATLSDAASAEPETKAIAEAHHARIAIEGLARLRAAALRQMAIPGDAALSTLIQAELSVPVPGNGTVNEQASARARLNRVRWAAPLLVNPEPVLQRADELWSAMGTAEPDPDDSSKEMAQAEQAAKAAAQLAAKAQAEAADSQLQAMVADVRTRIAAELKTEASRHADARARLAELSQQIEAQRAELSTASAPLVSDRQARFQKVLRDSRQTLASIRSEHASLIQISAEAAQRQAAADAELSTGQDTIADPATAQYRAAIADYRAVHTRVRAHLDQEHDETLSLLSDAKRVRDSAYSRADSATQREIPSVEEIIREAKETPTLLAAKGRKYLKAVQSLPAKAIDINAVGEILLRLIELILLVGIWTAVRGRLSQWIGNGLHSIDPRQGGAQKPWATPSTPGWMVPGDVSALKEPLVSVSRALLDLIVAYVLYSFLVSRVPILGLLIFFVVVSALARLLPDLVNLALVTPTETRPALRVTSEGTRVRAQWTTKTLVLWWGFDASMCIVGNRVMDAPRIAGTAHTAALILLGLLILHGLYRWAPEIQAKLSLDGQPSGINTWVTQKDAGIIGVTIRALVGAVILIIGMAVTLITVVIEGRGGLGWLSAAIARRQLKTDDTTPRVPISAEQMARIRSEADKTLEPASQISQILALLEDWSSEHRQGMIAVAADRGMGKGLAISTLTSQICEHRRVVELSMTARMTQPQDALHWLAEGAGLSEFSLPAAGNLEAQAEAVGEALNQLPESVFIVDDIHRLFLRRVGGFDALRAVFIAMQSSCTRHFWLCTFHEPAFSFLDGVRTVSHMGVFRAHIQLDPVPATKIRAWLEQATIAAGHTPHYDALLQQPGSPSHLQRMRKRTSAAYWRLLTEASQGNPSVALDYWMTALHLSDSGSDGTVDVTLFQAPDDQRLESLEDTALFTLSSLIIHDGATLEELHASLNLPESEVRGTCRTLEAMGIIEDEDGDDTFEVTNRWLPAVERLLRRKSFLHRR